MDKFGIFKLLNSFFDFYKNNKDNFFTTNKPENDANTVKTHEPLPAKNTSNFLPLQTSMLKTIRSHEDFVKRVMQKNDDDIKWTPNAKFNRHNNRRLLLAAKYHKKPVFTTPLKQSKEIIFFQNRVSFSTFPQLLKNLIFKRVLFIFVCYYFSNNFQLKTKSKDYLQYRVLRLLLSVLLLLLVFYPFSSIYTFIIQY